jgi:hypothetical protein
MARRCVDIALDVTQKESRCVEGKAVVNFAAYPMPRGEFMRDRFVTSAAFATFALASAALSPLAYAQAGPGMASTPLAVDLKKVPVGSWAEYAVDMGDQKAKANWALVARTSDSVSLEMSMEGGPLQQAGGKMTVRLRLAPDPIKAEKPVKQMVMQFPGKDPMLMPEGAPVQKFEKPDPKKLVGKETLALAGGSFATSHYRDTNDRGTIDIWITEAVPPLGLVKMTVTPKAGSPMPPVKMELAARGKDAKPIITKDPKPFDPAAMMGAAGGGPPPASAGAPKAAPAAPPASPPPAAPKR